MKSIIVSVADIRKEPIFQSERVSQLVYGEPVKILGSSGEYSLVEGPDKLQGYVKSTLIGNSEKKTYKLRKPFASRIGALPFGSYVNEDDVREYKIPSKFLVGIDSEFLPTKLSHEFLGIPYLWGGTSSFGFDCSGFTQRLFRFCKVELPRNADWQRDSSEYVNGFDDARKGDLVFFEGHVALYLGNHRIIHANGQYMSVTYTDLSDGSDYSKKLMGIFEKIGRFEGVG